MSGLAAALKALTRTSSGVQTLKIDRLVGDDPAIRELIIAKAQEVGVLAIARTLTDHFGEQVGPKAVTTWLERQSH